MDITEIIIVIINGLLVPIVMWAINEGTKYLKVKVNNEKLNGYILLVEKSVQAVVADVAQNFTDNLRNAGEWNADTAAQAATTALQKTKEMIGSKVYQELNLIIGDAEQYIKSRIEEEVRKNKTAQIIKADEFNQSKLPATKRN